MDSILFFYFRDDPARIEHLTVRYSVGGRDDILFPPEIKSQSEKMAFARQHHQGKRKFKAKYQDAETGVVYTGVFDAMILAIGSKYNLQFVF